MGCSNFLNSAILKECLGLWITASEEIMGVNTISAPISLQRERKGKVVMLAMGAKQKTGFFILDQENFIIFSY